MTTSFGPAVSAHSDIVMKVLLNKITKMNKVKFDRSKAIVDLQEKGYDVDFVLIKGPVAPRVQGKSAVSYSDFEITERHLFIDKLHPENSYVIFAMHVLDTGTRGVLMVSRCHCQDKS